jgi:hypothetical protein
MKVEMKKEVSVTLVLDEEEAKILTGIMGHTAGTGKVGTFGYDLYNQLSDMVGCDYDYKTIGTIRDMDTDD